MVSLWGSKNDEDEHEDGDGDSTPTGGEESRQPPPRRSEGRDADERTRLLPPRRDGFLDPDDPAVRAVALLKDCTQR